MTTLNMSVSRLCVFLAVLVSVKKVAAEPQFGQIFCDLFCDDDDDYDSSDSFLDYFFDCSDCVVQKPSSLPSKSTTQHPIGVIIPPANGINLTMTNSGGSWWLNLVPWAANSAATTKAPSAASTTAGATTAAATTAADGNTTAAPTTTTKAS